MTLAGANGVRLRRAEPRDAGFLAALAASKEVAPYLAVRSPREAGAFREEIERAAAAPAERGRFVVDVEGEDGISPAGSIAFARVNRRSRIANLYGLMLAADFRGCGVGREATRLFARHLLDDLGFHQDRARMLRLQHAGDPPLRALWVRARGREAAGVPPGRELGRRRPWGFSPRTSSKGDPAQAGGEVPPHFLP